MQTAYSTHMITIMLKKMQKISINQLNKKSLPNYYHVCNTLQLSLNLENNRTLANVIIVH